MSSLPLSMVRGEITALFSTDEYVYLLLVFYHDCERAGTA